MGATKNNAYTEYALASVCVARQPDGSVILRSPQLLQPYARCVGDWLEHWGRRAPLRTYLAERDGNGGWRRISYGETLLHVRAIGQELLKGGLSPQRPVAILSGNSINHALLTLAAMHVGVPVAPLSPAYSLISRDHAKLRSILELIRPGLVYVDDEVKFSRALTAVDLRGATLCTNRDFSEFIHAPAGPAVDRSFSLLGADSIAKILFTSGSTGAPKGVINTQRMLCANQQSIAQVWRFRDEAPPVLLDWLPWSHTFGGNHNFNMVLCHGGTLYIDGGRPQPGLIEETVANLREIAPTMYFNVPRGFDMLLPHLEHDHALRAKFFARLEMLFYAAAALPQHLWTRLDALARAERGQGIAMLCGWGSTETAPVCTNVHFPVSKASVIGLPLPGVELKMVPLADKFELRLRGANVTPGYYGDPEATAQAFDEEGYYRIGDAGRFADPSDPTQGIEFAGRLAEDFKLMSGVWVHVGMLRVKAIEALAPIAQDVVVTGHGRDEIGFLIFPNFPACRALCPQLHADAPLAQLLAEPSIVLRVRESMARLALARGSSRFATRSLLMLEPPAIDAGEITDKGYVNQSATLSSRAHLVERLHATPIDPAVILLDRSEMPQSSLTAVG